jgi:hypothetical protein
MLNYEFSVKEAEGEHYDKMRHYKAFCWYFEPRFSHSEIKTGIALIEAVEYAYDLQSTNLSRAV